MHSACGASHRPLAVPLQRVIPQWHQHTDVFLQVPLEGFISADFNRAGEIICTGGIAFETLRDELARFSIDEKTFQEFLNRHRADPSHYPHIDGVEVVKKSRIDD